MNWKFWEKQQNYTLKEPEAFRDSLVGSRVDAGVTVTEQTALQLSAVFAAVRILSESIGSLPLKVYQRRSDGGKDLALNHPLTKLFSGIPNDEQTPQELLEFIIASTLLRGTGYSEIERDGVGRVNKLHPLDSSYMDVKRDAAGRLIYVYNDPKNPKTYLNNEIWRVPGVGGNGVMGYSTLAYARQTLGTSIATERHAAKTFSNGTRVPAVFEMAGKLEDEAFDRLKGDLKAHAGVDNANTALLLEQGLTYKQVGMSHDDAQFLESRTFQIAEIARWFNVPLHMLSELSRATFSNIEHQGIEFVTYSLRPWCKRIENTIARDLLSSRDRGRIFVEFSMDALLRGDTKSRYEAHASAINNGWKNRNEVRALENMNPVDGLDEYLTPLNMGGAGEENQESRNALAQLNAKEVKAIRVEYARLQPDAFDAWLSDFYIRLADGLVSDGVDSEVARSWAAARMDAVLEADNILTLMDEWEQV